MTQLHEIIRSPRRRQRGLAVLGIFIALVLVALAFTVYFVNAIASPQSTASARIQVWVNQLNDERLTPQRHSAQQQLEQAGEVAVSPLITALHSPNVTLRRNAAEMLGFIASPQSIDALNTALLHDSAPAVRSRAAWALGEIRDVSVITMLERASVLDRNLQVRQAASGSIAAMRARLALAANKDERAVLAFAVAPNQTNIVYLAALRDILISRDGGKTWSPIAGTTPSRVTALVVSPTNPNTIYAGTESMGLYKSTDGGTTWLAVNDGLGIQPGVRLGISAIAVDANNPDSVYVATGNWLGTSQARLLPQNVMLTQDGGASWQTFNMPATSEAISLLVLINNNLYAVTDDRVIASNM